MSSSSPAMPHVAILMGCMNGVKYVAEQLDSFLAQTHSNWHLYVSDDGSTDGTLELLEQYKEKMPGRLTVFQGPRKGFAENFLSLVCNESIEADYYSYSDQDDIWVADKLSRAVAWHQSLPDQHPALYGSTTILVDVNANEIGRSEIFQKPFSFQNALLQNVAPGNTMVFNKATRDIMRQAGRGLGVIAHDWWTYIVTTGSGGHVFIDPVPGILYRQHGGNLIGANGTFSAKAIRARKLLAGALRQWGDAHVRALDLIKDRLSSENLSIYELYRNSRNKGVLTRAYGLKRAGIYRQTMLGNIGIAVAVLLRKV